MILYNEIEPFCNEWLKELMFAGELPWGDIDGRSIQELVDADLKDVTQFHTFAGIGGWPLALKLAGWPDDEEVWTGSCPCQPFSVAGKRGGVSDKRHLWPEFLRLIAERRPATIFGEQVASADGRLWLAGVRSDLEALGYRVGVADLCAAGVGAPHIRQRLYWVADLPDRGLAQDADVLGRGRGRGRDGDSTGSGREIQTQGLRAVGGLGNGNEDDAERRLDEPGRHTLGRYEQALSEWKARDHGSRGPSEIGRLENGHGQRLDTPGQRGTEREIFEQCGGAGGMGDGESDRYTWEQAARSGRSGLAHDGPNGSWSDYRIVPCTDGKARRTGARVFPLAHGLPRGMGQGGTPVGKLARRASRARIGMLKGSGNAIVPELAAVFIRSFLDVRK